VIDTVIGKNHKQALVTIVERKSKFMVMKKVENKTAELVAAATIELLRPYKDRCSNNRSNLGNNANKAGSTPKSMQYNPAFLNQTEILNAAEQADLCKRVTFQNFLDIRIVHYHVPRQG